MDLRHAADAYRQSSLENAPPVKIVRLLYEGAIRFLGRAAGRPVTDGERARWLGRADAIVKELRCSLEPGPDPALAENLEQLYLFVEDRIAAARLDGDDAPIEEASVPARSSRRSRASNSIRAWARVSRRSCA